MVHCWEDKEETTGKWEGAWPVMRRFYCLLENGHSGPHRWVDADNIQIRFKDGPSEEEEA